MIDPRQRFNFMFEFVDGPFTSQRFLVQQFDDDRLSEKLLVVRQIDRTKAPTVQLFFDEVPVLDFLSKAGGLFPRSGNRSARVVRNNCFLGTVLIIHFCDVLRLRNYQLSCFQPGPVKYSGPLNVTRLLLRTSVVFLLQNSSLRVRGRPRLH